MKPFEIIVVFLVGLLFLSLIATAVLSGQDNKSCRDSGGVPVRADYGYACIHQGAPK